MKKNRRIAVLALAALAVTGILFFVFSTKRGSVEALYKDDLSGYSVEDIYFYIPRDDSVDYRLKEGELPAALDHILSLELQSVLLQSKYSGERADWPDRPWISLVTYENGVHRSILSLILLDAETVAICKGDAGNGRVYKLTAPFDQAGFQQFFEVQPTK